MNNFSLRDLFYPMVIVLVLTFLPSKINAQDPFAGIDKVIVTDFYDQTKKSNEVKAADLVRNEMIKQSKFKVLPKDKTLAKYNRLGIEGSKMILKNYRAKVGKSTNADAFLVGLIAKGTMSKYVLKLKMERVAPPSTIKTLSFPFNKYVGEKAAQAAVAKFLGTEGMRTAKAPKTTAPVTVMEVPPEPMEEIAPYEKPPETVVEKRPSKMPTEEKFEATGGEKAKRDWMTVKFAPAIFKNNYSVNNPTGSAVINLIDIDTSFFPGISLAAEGWFFRYIGIDVLYNMGFLNLDVTPPAGTAYSVKAKLYQLQTGLKGRIFLMKREKSPYLYGRFGYSLQKFSPGTQPAGSEVLSSNKYTELTMGIGSKIPFWFIERTEIGLTLSFDMFMLSKLKEGVVNNGLTNDPMGYQFAMGSYWKFYKSMFTSIDFVYNYHKCSFANADTALGSRADVEDHAKSKDTLLGMFLFFGFTL